MRVLFVAGLIAAGALVLGCGESETKTVTETVSGETAAAPEKADAAEATQGATPTATTIPDGTWKRGEYTPGTYRAPGGELCSWEQNELPGGEKEGESFNENYGIGETNILIKINSPYFTTQECGTWEKVG